MLPGLRLARLEVEARRPREPGLELEHVARPGKIHGVNSAICGGVGIATSSNTRALPQRVTSRT